MYHTGTAIKKEIQYHYVDFFFAIILKQIHKCNKNKYRQNEVPTFPCSNIFP